MSVSIGSKDRGFSFKRNGALRHWERETLRGGREKIQRSIGIPNLFSVANLPNIGLIDDNLFHSFIGLSEINLGHLFLFVCR